MTALSIQPTYPIFTDVDGSPLQDGFVYIGAAGEDPESNPIRAYTDPELTVEVEQPIRTRNGYPSIAGQTVRLYVNSDYSIVAKNRNFFNVYESATATERYSQDVITGGSGSISKIGYKFDPLLGGYPEAAIVLRGDETGYWQNTVNGNNTNPDASGAGWQAFPPQSDLSGVSAQGGWMATGVVMQDARSLCVASNGDIYGIGRNGASAVIYKVDLSGNVTTTSISTGFNHSMAFAIKEMSDGNIYFGINLGTEYLKIGKINVSTFSASIVFTAGEVTFGYPSLADGGNGNLYFICGGDVGSIKQLRKYNFLTGVTTVAHTLPESAGINGAVSVTRKLSKIYVGYSTYTGLSTNLSGLEIIESLNTADSFSSIYTSVLDGDIVSTVSIASNDDNVLHVQFTKAGYISVAKVVNGALNILHRIKSPAGIYVLEGSSLEFLNGNFYFSSYVNDWASINIYRMDASENVYRHSSSATLPTFGNDAYTIMQDGGVARLYTPASGAPNELALSI